MNNFNIEKIEFINSSKCKINGELWCKAEPTAVTAERKPYFPKPENGNEYRYINMYGINGTLYTGETVDVHLYHTLNCWLDKSEAEAYVARYGKYLPDRLTLAIRRWKIANGVEDRFEWYSKKEKSYITYDYRTKEWRVFIGSCFRDPSVEFFPNSAVTWKCLTDLQEYFDEQLNAWNAESEGK